MSKVLEYIKAALQIAFSLVVLAIVLLNFRGLHLAAQKFLERAASVSAIKGWGVEIDMEATNRALSAADAAGDVDNKEVLDAALIAAAQAVEHYEITRYGALVSWAKQLGRSDCASMLQRNLEEERAADQKLTQIAESKVNLEAA
jgi:hypothetical protein